MATTAEQIKELRESTGLGVMECKRALEETDGNMEKAREIVVKRSANKVKPNRVVEAGVIGTYVHNDRIGAMIQLNCETDFVAKTPQFKTLATDIAQHIVGTNPLNVEMLLKEDFIKNTKYTIQSLIDECQGKCGENIKVSQFTRYDLGTKFKAL